MWIPFFGWYLAKARCVPVDRKAGSLALVQMTARAKDEAQHGRQIIIFPEGTRRRAGRTAGLQVRRGASLPESRLPLHSGRA